MPDQEGEKEESIIIQPAGCDGEPPPSVPGSTWVPHFQGFSQEEAEEKGLRPSQYKLVNTKSDEEIPVSPLFSSLPFDRMRRDFKRAGETKKGSKD